MGGGGDTEGAVDVNSDRTLTKVINIFDDEIRSWEMIFDISANYEDIMALKKELIR